MIRIEIGKSALVRIGLNIVSPMKNIQVIDGADNCVYDIFAATDEEFSLIFPDNQNVAFIDEVYMQGTEEALNKAFKNIWARRLPKHEAQGTHGLLFYELEKKESLLSSTERRRGYKPKWLIVTLMAFGLTHPSNGTR